MKKIDIIERILGKYIQKQIESNIKQIRKDLIREQKETQFNYHKDQLIPAMDKVYELINQPKPCRFSGYIDMSSIRNGDTIEMLIYFFSTDGEPKRFFRKVFENQQIDSIFTIDEKLVDGVKITIKQTAGTANKPILYNWRWQYI